ncbi:MAG: 16S rRNA (cytosine(1402)-N(4))-methyltransferase RsmH [Actinomycetota bacterium]
MASPPVTKWKAPDSARFLLVPAPGGLAMAQDRQPGFHRPVMVGEVVELLGPVPPGVVVDATFGGGGHAVALLRALGPDHRVLGIDRDPEALGPEVAGPEAVGREMVKPEDVRRLTVVRGNFAELARILTSEGVGAPVGVLFDFGVSARHLDDPARGFSYRHAGPLDMRMDQDQDLTAADLVNELDEAELARIIRRFGEEPAADRIAAAIVRARPLTNTLELAGIVAAAASRGRTSRRHLHPARRTFQALRMAVNGELEAIEAGLDQALSALTSGGRCVAIAYHSIEDRVVKARFAAAVGGCVCPPELPVCGCGASPQFRSLTRGAKKPSADELSINRRARSARLRAVEKVRGEPG